MHWETSIYNTILQCGACRRRRSSSWHIKMDFNVFLQPFLNASGDPLLSDYGHWFWIGELCAHKWTTCNDAKWWWLPVSRSAPPSNTQKRTQAAHYFHHPSFFLREKYQFLDQTFSHRCIGSGPPHTYYRFGMTTTLVERKTREDYILATCVGWCGGLYIFLQGLLTQTYW